MIIIVEMIDAHLGQMGLQDLTMTRLVKYCCDFHIMSHLLETLTFLTWEVHVHTYLCYKKMQW